MTRKTWMTVVAAIVAIALAIGGYVAFFRDSGHLERARAYANAAAASLAKGTVPAGVDAPDAAAAQEALTVTLDGMGAIPRGDRCRGHARRQGGDGHRHVRALVGGACRQGRLELHHDHADQSHGRGEAPWSNAVVAPGLADTRRLGATRRAATRLGITGNDGTRW